MILQLTPMTEKALVSVITIFFNAEKFIRESIESIIAQSYDNWELLLVDDGSTDRSTAIAKSFAEQYPDKIIYLEHEKHQNRGMSATRNLGIRHAKGDYIAILDSDDLWTPHKLEEQVNILNTYPHVAMVYGRTQFWFSWATNQQETKDFLSGIGVKPNTIIDPPIMLTRFFKSCPYTCSVLVRRNVVLKLNGFEEAFRGMYEDQVFFAKVFAQESVFVSDKCWDKYRQHPESCCAIATEVGLFHPEEPSPTTYIFLTWLKNYLIQKKIRDLRVWLSLQIRLIPYEYPAIYKLFIALSQDIENLKQQTKKMFFRGFNLSIKGE